jgi:Asp-tRNA(Asn)/Glu-tRNA(Gln) amidotransferase C subunit
MSPAEEPDRDRVEAMAQAQGLDLPAERLATLTRTFSDFVAKFDEVWQIDPGEHEPSAITFDNEARP